jgi:N-acetylmuramoyl-L-alanine amidase
MLREILEANQRLEDLSETGRTVVVPAASPRPHHRFRWLLALPLVAAAVTFAAWERPEPTATAATPAMPTAEMGASTPAAAEPTGGAPQTVATAAPRPPFSVRPDGAGSDRTLLPDMSNAITLPAAALRAVTGPDPSADAMAQDLLTVYAGPATESGMTLKSLFGLDVRTIVIDPGHGGRDPGTSGRLGTREKDVTLDVALRLRELLQHDHNIRVVLTRDADTAVSLHRRVELANRAAVDLFLSIHVNYLENSTLNVVETYYFGTHSDPAALRLAQRENRGSEYGMSDFEGLVRNMRNTIKLQESKRLASAIQSSLTGNMLHANRELLDVGIKTAPFVVLLGVKAPAVLAEISCMCNPEAEQRLRTPGHREELARYIAEGIVNYLQENANKGGESNDRQRQAKKG